MNFKVYTLGCKVNTYESEYVINELIKKGYVYIDNNCDIKADICVINTCTVTNISDQKSRKMIRNFRKNNPNACIAVMGCFSQKLKDDDEIIKYADVVIGNTNKNKIVNLIEEYLNNKKKIVKIEDINSASFEDIILDKFNTRTRALIKIEDGCENFCSYCIIPYVRGKVRSKDMEEVISEAKTLVNNGYKEIVLTGIHTGHYGADKNYDFSDLLLKLNEIDNLERIRISSIEITELNDKFLDTLKNCKKIANHMHIPLQAGSDKILKLMNRKYDLNYYYDKIEKIRKIRPNISITTDVIVGFPSEDEEDFLSTINFVKKVNFSSGHVFPFSSRYGTVADKMKDKITNEEKHKRSKRLIEVFNILEENYYKENINNVLSVIPETYSDGYLTGHTSNYLKVKFKGCKNLIGNLVNIKIESYENKILIGNIAEK